MQRGLLILLSLASGCWPVCLQAQSGQSHAYVLSGDYGGTHDPCIIRSGETWYVFATGKAPTGGQIPIRCSMDLTHWRFCGQVFDAVPAWIQSASPGTKDLWAPDISRYKGEFRLYYAYSLFGKNTSGIALATNKTLDSASPGYHWADRGLVFESHASDDYNAIDPNFVVDEDGRSWLAFGSFWGGIKLFELNASGKAMTEPPKLYSLAARARPAQPEPAPPGLPANWQAIEAPFIVRHLDFYYLFVSWDLCCKGTRSTYRTMVGRSRAITGPYVDKSGKPMLEGGGTEVLSKTDAWLGPGGESLLIEPPEDLIVFHAYDAQTGKPALQLSTVAWSAGWPKIAIRSSDTR